MKKFQYADVYLLKSYIYGGLFIWSENRNLEKGFLFLTLLMFVFYFITKFEKKQ